MWYYCTNVKPPVRFPLRYCIFSLNFSKFNYVPYLSKKTISSMGEWTKASSATFECMIGIKVYVTELKSVHVLTHLMPFCGTLTSVHQLPCLHDWTG